MSEAEQKCPCPVCEHHQGRENMKTEDGLRTIYKNCERCGVVLQGPQLVPLHVMAALPYGWRWKRTENRKQVTKEFALGKFLALYYVIVREDAALQPETWKHIGELELYEQTTKVPALPGWLPQEQGYARLIYVAGHELYRALNGLDDDDLDMIRESPISHALLGNMEHFWAAYTEYRRRKLTELVLG